MIICVDFDGTVVEHQYPQVGPDVPGAAAVLQALVAKGHKIILWTMRDGVCLSPAVAWFFAHNIPLYGANQNPDQHWSKSPKAYANIYIDDAALGCPLLPDSDGGKMVDWKSISDLLTEKGYFA